MSVELIAVEVGALLLVFGDGWPDGPRRHALSGGIMELRDVGMLEGADRREALRGTMVRHVGGMSEKKRAGGWSIPRGGGESFQPGGRGGRDSRDRGKRARPAGRLGWARTLSGSK